MSEKDKKLKLRKKILDLLDRYPETDTFELSVLLDIPYSEVLDVIEELERESLIEFL